MTNGKQIWIFMNLNWQKTKKKNIKNWNMIYAAIRLRIQTVIFTAYTNIYIQRLFVLLFTPKSPEIWSPFFLQCFFKCLFKLHNINKSSPKNYICFIQKNVALERKSITNNNSIASRLCFQCSLFQYCYMMIIFTTCGVLFNKNNEKKIQNLIFWICFII